MYPRQHENQLLSLAEFAHQHPTPLAQRSQQRAKRSRRDDSPAPSPSTLASPNVRPELVATRNTDRSRTRTPRAAIVDNRTLHLTSTHELARPSTIRRRAHVVRSTIRHSAQRARAGDDCSRRRAPDPRDRSGRSSACSARPDAPPSASTASPESSANVGRPLRS